MSLTVIKVGGDIVRSEVINAVASDVATLTKRGDKVVVIHGGGPQATELQRQLGQEPNVVAGRRITDEAALEVMKMVVGGRLNIDVCSALIAAGAQPVGLHGGSSWAVEGVKRPPVVVSGGGPEPIDFGHVGDVVGVNEQLLQLLIGAGHVPVIACLAADRAGRMFNINADIVANQAAKALGADHLVLVTSAHGVMRDIDDADSRIPTLTVVEARAAIADGTVKGGMIPKLEESMRVLEHDVGAIHIIGHIKAGDLLAELVTPGSIGTALLP